MKVFSTLEGAICLIILIGLLTSYCGDHDVNRHEGRGRKVTDFMAQMEKEFGDELSWVCCDLRKLGRIRMASNYASGWVLVVDEPARTLPEGCRLVSKLDE